MIRLLNKIDCFHHEGANLLLFLQLEFASRHRESQYLIYFDYVKTTLLHFEW